MQRVMRQPRAGVPFKRAGHYFVSRNDGSQNQDVIFVATSLAELLDGGRVLIDPNTFATDGTSSLTSLTVSGDGRLVAYGLSEAGSDWTTFRLLDLASGDRNRRRADPDQVLPGGMAGRSSLLRLYPL